MLSLPLVTAACSGCQSKMTSHNEQIINEESGIELIKITQN